MPLVWVVLGWWGVGWTHGREMPGCLERASFRAARGRPDCAAQSAPALTSVVLAALHAWWGVSHRV